MLHAAAPAPAPDAAERDLGRVALLAALLGLALGLHLAPPLLELAGAAPPLRADSRAWCLWAAALAAFHLLEFLLTARARPAAVSAESFLLNHSRAYHAALLAAVLEFALWRALAPEARLSPAAARVSAAGLLLVALGQAVRAVAMWQCGPNFTHLVASQRAPGHELVRRGVYSVLRHPAYFGWFWWSVGTQLLLMNPVCAVLYAWASWRFFADRVPHEELTLLDFFGEEYADYAASTVIGIPGVESPAASAGAARRAAMTGAAARPGGRRSMGQ